MDYTDIITKITNVCTDNFPKELQAFDAWVLWQPDFAEYEAKGKIGKKPINPRTGGYAKVNVPETWGSFDLAVRKRKAGQGLSFGLSPEFGITGIDIDHCINEEGIINADAMKIVERLDSYSEVSPSGKGLRIFVYGNLPQGGNRQGNVELYNNGRFLTVTGQHIKSTPLTIESRQDELNQLHLELFGKQKAVSAPKPRITADNALDDAELIQRARASKNGGKFARLFDGDDSSYESQSQADQALCSMLAFWTGNDAGQMDRLFRRSGLMREKWDEKHGAETYGAITISKAIKGNTAIYEPYTMKDKPPKPSPPVGFNLGEVVSGELGAFAQTDLGNAERFVNQHKESVRYCSPLKSWLIWDGKRWKEDVAGRIFYLARQTVRSIPKEADQYPNGDTRRAEVLKWAAKSESKERVKAMVELAQSDPSIVIDPENFDADPFLLNCFNGTLDLHTGKLLSHDRNHMITKIAPVEFNPEAQCPQWLQFLKDIFPGNTELVSYLQKVSGYCLTGSTKEQDFFLLYGTGANGKSTFFRVLMDLLGRDYAKQTAATALLAKTHETQGEEIAVLQGARLVCTIEIDDGKKLAEGLVKQLTGGDRIRARRLYANSFEFMPTFKLLMACNHRPRVSGTDTGIWRRIKLIPFTVSIPENKQDPDLADKLREELPGVLNWALKGCLQWQKEGLTPPEEVNAATSSYRIESDAIGNFLEECITTANPQARTQAKTVYEAYREWSEKAGEYILNMRRFNDRLRERGHVCKAGTGNAKYWQGLGIIDHWAGMKRDIV